MQSTVQSLVQTTRAEASGILAPRTAEVARVRTGSVKGTGNSWGYVVDIGRVDGRRKQARKRGFRTRKLAREALNDALAELQRGAYVRPRKLTFGAYIDDWLDALATSGRRPTTISGYRKLIRVHVKPALGDVQLQEVTALDLDRLYARLGAVGSPDGRGPLSKRTIRYVHSVIGKALADAERKGLVQRNVARLASAPSAASARATEATVWTPDELGAFLTFVAKSHHVPMFRLAAMTGMRRAELCGLRWQDVDLDNARLVVRQAITTVDHAPSLGAVKSARSRRVIDVGLAFTMPDGRGWHPDVISRAFARLVQRSGLPRIRLHDLRHTHATHLLAAGANVRVVSERLGHASVAFTLDVYGHVLPGQQADAAAAVAALVDG